MHCRQVLRSAPGLGVAVLVDLAVGDRATVESTTPPQVASPEGNEEASPETSPVTVGVTGA